MLGECRREINEDITVRGNCWVVYPSTMKMLNEMRIMQVGEHVWEKESE